MVYELAWCYRVEGDAETDMARLKLQRDAVEKVRSRWPKDQARLPPGLGAPEIPLSDLPVQPAEKKAQETYQRVISAGAATVEGQALASQVRFEMAELLSQRGDIDAAMALLATALENQPPKALAQRIKVRVAAALLVKNNPQPALMQLQPILTDKETLVGAEARYLTGEANIQQKNWPKAIEALTPFRDQDPYRNMPGITERALMRLGYAMEQSGQWEPGRQVYEAIVSRFPQSAWLDEAALCRWAGATRIRSDMTMRCGSTPIWCTAPLPSRRRGRS